ncbi:hypothetical protein N7456_013279 [Penicillium angulare]|uniref:Uncharacterized protein n=1 Tax=Penicillium angulare TaxID=116970 RepID=A0A9W9EG00_9EURO|nr:hypothetical protein N7456_013279 [Penicillium angulare]
MDDRIKRLCQMQSQHYNEFNSTSDEGWYGSISAINDRLSFDNISISTVFWPDHSNSLFNILDHFGRNI